MRWTKKTNITCNDSIAKIVAQIVTLNTGVEAKLLRFDEKKYEYPGLDNAVAVFLDFVKRRRKIAFHGDYDAGATRF